MLECSVFIENNENPSLSFKRFVLGNVYIGLLDRDRDVRHNIHHHIHLCVVTLKNTLKYKVFENIKRINSVQILFGKISIEFSYPSHNILIRCDSRKLTSFFRQFQILCDEEKIHSRKRHLIPTIPNPLKFVSKPKTNETKSSVKDIIFQIPCPTLRKEVLKNAQILHLPNSNLHDLPQQLGLINWSEINLENNDLSHNDLLWLEELPVRRTLVTLNLSKNQLTSFPPALVDFHCLNVIDLRDNKIQYIPGTIGSLQCLRNLNLSNNQIRYLPASIVNLRLDQLDLTKNYLTSSTPVKDIPPERENVRTTLRLEDIAATKIDSLFRRKLSNKECPRRLLERLRCASQCVCGKKSMPTDMNQCYAPLPGLKFSACFSTLPQISDRGSSIFLQYHFCLNSNRCDSKKYQRMSSVYFSLT